MDRIGLSSYAKVLDEELFINYHKAGISCMEISPEMDAVGKHIGVNYKNIQRWAKEQEICLWSYHLPFGHLDISDIDQEKREECVRYHMELIEQGAEIGIQTFVIHASGEITNPISVELRKEKITYAKESLDRLARKAESCGAVIAVEDLPRSCLGHDSDEIEELIRVNEKLRVCFDTNHLLKEDNVRFIKKLGEKIVTIHVSDYDFTDEKHWMPGEGDIDWKELYQALKQVNYRGPWLYEISFDCKQQTFELGKMVQNPLSRHRMLTCEDFVRNATEIFHNVPLTVIGKRTR